MKVSVKDALEYGLRNGKPELKDSATVPGPGKEVVRKGLVRASLSYHPDHNKEYGVKWLVLCEEIQKKINEYVTSLKVGS